MKQKIFTLMIALMAMTMGAQNVCAEPTKDFEVTMTSGMNLLAEENKDVRWAIEMLQWLGQIDFSINEQLGSLEYHSIQTQKVLFTVNIDGNMDGIVDVNASAEDIYYTITNADRELIKNDDEGVYEEIEPYKAIVIHFSGHSDIHLALSGYLRTGTNLYDDEQAYMVSFLLWKYFNQITTSIDEEKEEITFISQDNKVLFIQKENGSITIAPGVTSADDIVYTITDEDRERLAIIEPEANAYILPYETIELHFIVPEKDLVIHLEDGMNIKEAGNEAIANAIELMTYYFYQLHWNYDFDTEAYTYSVFDENYYERELFTVASDGTLTLAPDVTAADNIYYLIEEDMREYLMEMGSELYDFIYPYKSISLLFGPAQPGDLDKDGRITVDDITLLIAIYLGEGSNPAADVDGDGNVTVDDITNLIGIYLNDGV